jgi:hypothetical protein
MHVLQLNTFVEVVRLYMHPNIQSRFVNHLLLFLTKTFIEP